MKRGIRIFDAILQAFHCAQKPTRGPLNPLLRMYRLCHHVLVYMSAIQLIAWWWTLCATIHHLTIFLAGQLDHELCKVSRLRFAATRCYIVSSIAALQIQYHWSSNSIKKLWISNGPSVQFMFSGKSSYGPQNLVTPFCSVDHFVQWVLNSW